MKAHSSRRETPLLLTAAYTTSKLDIYSMKNNPARCFFAPIFFYAWCSGVCVCVIVVCGVWYHLSLIRLRQLYLLDHRCSIANPEESRA